MDIDAVIAAHAIWKSRLRSVLRTGDPKTLNPASHADAVGCEVGRWIRYAAPRLGSDPDFLHLERVHQTFHHMAGEAVRAAILDVEAGLALLKAPAFQEASMETISALMRLRARLD